MTENNEPSKSRARTTAPEGSIDIHEYIDGKNFVPEPNIKSEVGQKASFVRHASQSAKERAKNLSPGALKSSHISGEKRCARLDRLASSSLTSCLGIH